jgi:hypothetical protein
MVLAMHYAGAAVIEKYGRTAVRHEVAAGRHLSTLAFSETGSRSHFWAPTSTAKTAGTRVELDAEKSWVTSAAQADAYVWSSRPLKADGASTLWLVPAHTPGNHNAAPYDGLGLRGNDSRPVTAERATIAETSRLGEDGGGFAIMMGTVLPYFNLMSAAFFVGLMEAGTTRTAAHAAQSRYAHMDSTLADLPTIRAYVARMRVKTDMAERCSSRRSTPWKRVARMRCCACWSARPRPVNRRSRSWARPCACAGRRVPQGCGSRAVFPGCAGGERHGADDRPALRLHREGGLRSSPFLSSPTGVAETAWTVDSRCGRLRPEGRDDLGRVQAALLERGFRSTSFSIRTTSGRSKDRRGARRVELAAGVDRAERAARAKGRRARAIAMRDTDRDLTSIFVVRADAPVHVLGDLAGRTVAVGASDSPQATLIPLLLLSEAGLRPGVDFEVLRHDLLVGKHGDHIGGEREAARVLIAGRAQARA